MSMKTVNTITDIGESPLLLLLNFIINIQLVDRIRYVLTTFG